MKRKEKTMKTVVNEPQGEYRVANWQTEFHEVPFDDLICGIENGVVMSCPSSGSTNTIFFEKPKRKLSSLRGKLTMQSKQEIDEQVSKLRSEWDRNI